ncbi:MAG: type II toxin-antitoxin system RelE/ParE family toxin [Nitrospinae bacterium]|nr:type II toxin-antitoxin system RelE/ParE family toxin [Nitrospinota bacterium]
MYNIEWTVKAFRQVKKIKDRETRTQIIDAVETLKHFPGAGNVARLQNRDDYRLRVGRWRVIFEVERSLKIIEVQEVKIRNEDTY